MSVNVLVSAWVFSGCLAQSKDMQIGGVRSTGDSRLTVGVNGRVDGCLSPYVGPCRPRPFKKGQSGIENGWTDDAVPL